MLVIRRRVGEAFLIGNEIEVRVVEISAHRVVLGIEAPKQVMILRSEVRDAAEQNLEAARSATPKNAELLAAQLRQSSVR